MQETGTVRLGYKDGKWDGQQHNALLVHAGSGKWERLTVGMSMRETENEINLLVPGGKTIYNPIYGEPAWKFGPPSDDDTAEDGEPTEGEA